MNDLVILFVERDGMGVQEAKRHVRNLQNRVANGDDIMEIAYEEMLEADYLVYIS